MVSNCWGSVFAVVADDRAIRDDRAKLIDRGRDPVGMKPKYDIWEDGKVAQLEPVKTEGLSFIPY